MIELEAVYYRYPGSQAWCLNGVDLTVRKGEMILVAGESGSGKSTLAYLLGGFIPQFLGGTISGRGVVDGLDVIANGPSELLSVVALAIQNADAQLFNPTVEEEIAFGLESLGVPSCEIASHIEQACKNFGISHLLKASPTELSGGQKRIVSIAALASLPSQVLVLDEPFAHLDEVSTRKVRDALKRLHKEGRTVVVAEHRVRPILEDVDRCVIMEGGRIDFEGPPQKAHSELADRGLIPTYGVRPSSDLAGRPVVLEVRDLHSDLGERQVLRGVSLELHEGEALAILGPNGSGKTTLIKHLNGLLRPKKGEVRVMGKPLGSRDPSQIAREVGIVFQNPNDQFFCSTVKDEILSGLPSSRKEIGRHLEEVLSIFGLKSLLDRSPYRLSEGEKKRVAIASVLALGSRILVLDEPTAGQDGRSRMELARLLRRLQGSGISMLIATHDRPFACAVADRIVEMESGTLRVYQASESSALAQRAKGRMS